MHAPACIPIRHHARAERAARFAGLPRPAAAAWAGPPGPPPVSPWHNPPAPQNFNPGSGDMGYEKRGGHTPGGRRGPGRREAVIAVAGEALIDLVVRPDGQMD